MAPDHAGFQQIVENTDTAILVCQGPEIVYANQACAKLFGYTAAQDLVDLGSCGKLWTPEPQPAARQTCAADLYRGHKKNGSAISLHLRSQAIQWQGEAAQCLYLSEAPCQPGPACHSTKAEPAKGPDSVSRLIDAIHQISSAVALFDRDDRLVFCNPRYARFLDPKDLQNEKLTFEEVLRISIANNVIPDALPDPEGWIENRLAAHMNPRGPLEIRRQDGTWEAVHEHRTEDGSTLLISNDITEQKKAEKAHAASEAYLRAFVDNSPAAVFLKDKNANFIYVNDTYREWQNVTDEEIIGSSIYSHFPAPVAVRIAEQDRLALEEGKSSNVESRTLFPDGVERSVMAIRFPVIDQDGAIIGVSGFITDTSDHYRAMEEFEKKMELYTSVLDNLPIGVTVKDSDGRYLVANKQIQEWRNKSESDFIGKRPRELFNDPETLRQAQEKHELDIRRTLEVVKREEWRDCDDGEKRFLEWIKFPILNKQGELSAIGTIGTDLTGRKSVEQHLRDAKEAAEVASRAKSEFLAHMSHELRTPLNAVIGFSQVMMEHTFGPLGHENYNDYARDIHSAGNHLLNVIGDILDISKIEAGEIELDNSHIDVGHLMASSIKMMRSRADTAGVVMAMKVPRDLPLFEGDELRLRQILLNLLSNSIKFTKPGGQVSLAVEVADNGGMIWHVTDTGVGISREDISRVLRPFEQVRQSFQLSHEGTGLGLYLTKTLAELHDGTLTLQSTLHEGTRVSLQFPPERTICQGGPAP